MTTKRFTELLGVSTAFAAIMFVGMLNNARHVKAHEEGDDEKAEARIERGFQLAPVHLQYDRENRKLVGLGSYYVNGMVDCNGCHSLGPATEFAPGGNPYLRIPPFTGTEQINTATYLAGGRDFGPVGSVPHLYSRNLTPDKSGRPEGGRTFAEFVQIMRHGTDLDHLHLNCTAPGVPANCFAPPFNGDLLQVMPWPQFKNMTDHDLRAIYEYLKAIPCNPGPAIPGGLYQQNVCN